MQDRLKFRTPHFDKTTGNFCGFNYFTAGETCRGNLIDSQVFGKDEQCTGLTDKNGNLIYEGDVCFCKTPGQKPRYIVFVYNAKYSQMQFRPLNNKQKTDVFSFSEQSPSGAFPFEWLEIIGNIHTATVKDGE